MDTEIRRKPGRPPMVDRQLEATRDEVVSEGRRRRKNAGDRNVRLFVPPEMYEPGGVLDRAVWESRWINDEDNRLERFTRYDDWDVVSRAGQSRVDGEDAMKYPIGEHRDGRTRFAYLCRKLKTFADEDRAEKAARVAEIQSSALSGKPRDVTGAEVRLEEAYIPRDR